MSAETSPIKELLCEYELIAAYSGDRGSMAIDVTLEGFAKHIEERLGRVALSELYEPWPHIKNEVASMMRDRYGA